MIAVVLFAVSATSSFRAQGNSSVADNDQPPCFSSRIGGRETKWFRYNLSIVSICIPDMMVRRKTERCGEKCFIFESDELYFDLDPSYSAWRPTFEKRYPTYSVTSKPIDGKPSNIWYFEDKGKYKYVAGLNMILERGQIGLGVYLFSKSEDPKPIADRMFNSIILIPADVK